MTTTSHANCTHEKTKKARAACRAGKLPADASARTGAPVTKPAERPSYAYEPSEDFVRKGNICGPCGLGNHDGCRVGGKQWFCTCSEADHTL
jgi:hypothetical protein